MTEQLYGISKEMFREFEELRRSGKINMWGSSRYLGWNSTPIFSHYEEMAKVWSDVVDELRGR